MKKLILILASLSFMQISFGKDIYTTDTNQLPKTSREFLKKHFPNDKIAYISIDKEFSGTEYEVKLENGQKITFDSKGEWEEIKSKQAPIPESIIPAPVKKQLDDRYPKMPIKQIECKRWGYEVELFNGLEIKFDKGGTILAIED